MIFFLSKYFKFFVTILIIFSKCNTLAREAKKKNKENKKIEIQTNKNDQYFKEDSLSH